jgi:hypothetical protein
MLSGGYEFVPLMFGGYIDPSTGQVFSSMGPVVLSVAGGVVGMVVVFLVKVKNKLWAALISILGKSGSKSGSVQERLDSKEKNEKERNRDDGEESSDIGD